MAKGAIKRIAHRNEATIKVLKLGMIVPTVLNLLLRLIFRRSSLPPSKTSLALYIVTLLPSLFLSNYLVKIGTPRRDSTTGTILSYGEDLSQPGITEWCFDILYITWTCEVGSGIFGDRFWLLYLVIPLYAIYKIWISVISPYFGGGRSSTASDDGADKDQLSKRQEKLRKRNERGDPRVRVQAGRR